MQFEKHFTLKEARTLLPVLRQIFKDAQRRREQIQQADEKLGQMLTDSRGDLGGKDVTGMLMDLTHMNEQVARIVEMGVQIKDFNRGLVDFPHIREGREVFLCWELEEDDIEFWHDIDCGYAGRESL